MRVQRFTDCILAKVRLITKPSQDKPSQATPRCVIRNRCIGRRKINLVICTVRKEEEGKKGIRWGSNAAFKKAKKEKTISTSCSYSHVNLQSCEILEYTKLVAPTHDRLSHLQRRSGRRGGLSPGWQPPRQDPCRLSSAGRPIPGRPPNFTADKKTHMETPKETQMEA